MNSIIQKDSLSNSVQKYIHYDNLLASLNKQIHDTRIVRDNFELQIINELKDKKMENAIIQIYGGKLKIVEEKHISPLTFTSLEESLHQYFTSKKLNDETHIIIKFIKSQRSYSTTSKIKKFPQLPPQSS